MSGEKRTEAVKDAIWRCGEIRSSRYGRDARTPGGPEDCLVAVFAVGMCASQELRGGGKDAARRSLLCFWQ